MKPLNDATSIKREHVKNIFQENSKPSRLQQSFTNLSNTVIKTALSGQANFVFEILQNAEDAFEDPDDDIEVTFILQDDYFIVQHNGKGFDCNDVERICDYAPQKEEAKTTDLSKTVYKGLGFKSLFNLSDTIYIHSNGYSFRFDKTYWSDWQKKPWQIIPIWCQYEELPLHLSFPHDQPVNIILKVKDVDLIEKQIREFVIQPDLLLFLHRIKTLCLNVKGEFHYLERKSEQFGVFEKIQFRDNKQLKSTWLKRIYVCFVPDRVKKLIKDTSQFIYPDKIKNAKEVPFMFAVLVDERIKEITKIKGLLYCTLPTQLHLNLPYHINSFFILNLSRSQLHENEWNEFLIYQIGCLQPSLLKDVASIEFIRNYVLNIFCRKIDYPLATFCKAYLKGYSQKINEICWLPSRDRRLHLRLNEAWIDEIDFFKQNFKNIPYHNIYPYLISYDLKNSYLLSTSEDKVTRFSYQNLFKAFENKYYPKLTRYSYSDLINYLHRRLKDLPSSDSVIVDFKNVPLLRTKKGHLVTIKNALFLERGNVVPKVIQLNPVDCEYLSLTDTVEKWFLNLGASFLSSSQIIRESVLKWIANSTHRQYLTKNNHVEIMNYLAKNIDNLDEKDIQELKDGLLILTANNQFKLAKNCFFPDAIPVKEFSDIISNDEIISPAYEVKKLKTFFVTVGVCEKMESVDIIRKSVLLWINNNSIRNKITVGNYDFIIQYMANHYCLLERKLEVTEHYFLKRMLVFTLDQTFQQADTCFFDSAIPPVKGLHEAFPKSKLVSKNQNPDIVLFLSKIGVSDKVEPLKVITETVLTWIREGVINSQITIDNHLPIMKFIADHWPSFNYLLDTSDKEHLKQIPVLTKNKTFRKLQECYQFFSNESHKNIPSLELVISENEIVSSDYDSMAVKKFLIFNGARYPFFIDIYEKYSDYLHEKENMKWFFSNLYYYWDQRNGLNDKLFSTLKSKFESYPCLLTKSGQICKSVDIYKSSFNRINDIVPNIIPLLQYGSLTEDMQEYFGFKDKLDLKTISQLINALEKKENFRSGEWGIFYKTVLEQLRLENENEVKKWNLKLLSMDFKFKPANCLYYFEEEDELCELKSFYLNRVHHMSHEDTVELARLCGVNILPFQDNIIREGEIPDDTLKQFYLERLPFIAIQEARRLNKKPSVILEHLYDVVNSIKLYDCKKIQVQYPFGPPVKVRDYFDEMTLYVYGKWTNKKTKIHTYIKGMLQVKNIDYIIDLDLSKDIDEWLEFQGEDRQEFDFIEKKLEKLIREDIFEDYEPDSTSQLAVSRNNQEFKSLPHELKRLSTSNLQVCPLQLHNIPEGVDFNNSNVKWMGEMCVFHFLQDHYKSKYPISHSQLFNGLFFLQHQSRKIQITWLNEKVDRLLPYDLVIEKDDDIKCLIKVRSAKTAIGGSFSINQSDFIAKEEVADEKESMRVKKVCLFNILFPDVSSDVNLEQACQSYVLYKTVLYKNTIEK